MKKLISKIKSFGFLKVVLIIIVFVALINVCYRKYEEKILRDEMDKIMEIDLIEGKFNTSIKTIANYQKVEKAIKQYLSDYSNQSKEIIMVIDDENLRSVLSASNYIHDGPNFSNTMVYLTTSKEKINEGMKKLSHLSKKSSISSYIQLNHFNHYYQNIYEEYMINGSFARLLEDNMARIKQSSKNIIRLIDHQIKVLQFLSSNNDWTVKDDQIIFLRQEDLDMYNLLINEIT